MDKQNIDYTIKQDKGKPKLFQVPVEALNATCEIMDYGANKYGGGTWSRVEVDRCIHAALRHIYAMQTQIKDDNNQIKEGYDFASKDDESGIEHIKHALCNLVYAVTIYERNEK